MAHSRKCNRARRAARASIQDPAALPGKVPISVVMIVRNGGERLQACLQSLRTFLRRGDEVVIGDTGSNDGGLTQSAYAACGVDRVLDLSAHKRNLRPDAGRWLPDLLKDFEASDLSDGCILDFAAARTEVTNAARHDIQFWIDADDILYDPNPGQLRSLVDEVFTSGRGDSFFLNYEYARDDADGSLISVLKRERAFDRRVYHWVGRCHETNVPRPGVKQIGAAFFADLPACIRHQKPNTPPGGTNPSDIRNYIILRREVEESGEHPDPRTVFYLGNAARGCRRDAEAIECYRRLLDVSGSRDDRFAAAYYIGTIYLGPKSLRPADALDWYMRCLRLKPEDPRGPFGLSRAYFLLHRYQESMHWFRVGKLLPEPSLSLHNYDPRHVRAQPLQIAAAAAKELGDEALACQITTELSQVEPYHPDTKAVQDVIRNWVAGRRLVAGIQSIMANSGAPDGDALQRIGRELTSKLVEVPEELENAGLVPLESGPEQDNEVAIFCGQAWEPWGPKSGERGIGGSEKAVVQMARRLAARGLPVRVYANVPREQRGVHDGVVWNHFGAFDRARPRGTLICWRSPEMLEMRCPAQRRVVWCHDVQDPARWTDARIALADEVWVLSEYHATTLGPAREKLGAKVIITRNGIDADLYQRAFEKHGATRDPKRIIYASSPDRGVLTAIKLFKAADIPGATLHIYYGFTPMYLTVAAEREYFGCCDIGRDINMHEYMQLVLQTVDNDERIVWHGRVGWEQLAEEFCQSGVWLYPTRFSEISCMSAMEAQAAGLIPVCTGTAALDETIFFKNYQQSLDTLDATHLQDAVQSAEPGWRQHLHETACAKFSYDALADEWAERLKAPVPDPA